jgi:hypothetical protein
LEESRVFRNTQAMPTPLLGAPVWLNVEVGTSLAWCSPNIPAIKKPHRNMNFPQGLGKEEAGAGSLMHCSQGSGGFGRSSYHLGRDGRFQDSTRHRTREAQTSWIWGGESGGCFDSFLLVLLRQSYYVI